MLDSATALNFLATGPRLRSSPMSSLNPEPPSRFAYVLAGILALAVAGGWHALHRTDPPRTGSPPTTPIAAEKSPAAPPRSIARTATIADAENYFAYWGGYVIWEHDVAEFALWSDADRDYSQFFEVRRANGVFTFRKIPQLTRPLIDHGQPASSPMALTETAAMRAAFYRAHPNYKPTPRTWSQSARPTPDLPPKPPERFAPAGLPKPTPAGPRSDAKIDPRVGASIARGSGLIAEFSQALAQARLSPHAQMRDLQALFQLHPISPLSENPTPAELTTAIEERKAANESIAAMATALMPAQQLAVFRAVLARDVAKLETRRR